ncbi:MAG: DUF4157 domain-containing protein [Azoarcus sp.]|jgi:hypothetical protein|nr:DUF4157 domain-containing protein [Azoarcus sp.]
MIVPRPTDQELLALDNPPPAVLEKVEYFFPGAISWYEQVEAELLPKGRPLSQRETEFAIRVGVKDPSRVRIVVLNDFPIPSDPELRKEAERIGLGSKSEGGRTNGYVILLKPWTAESNAVISHELVHVAQQDRLGRESYLRRYLIEMEMMGYSRSPLELEAYEKQSSSL